MYKQEEIKPYSEKGEKAVQVEQMFNHIATTYDTLNHRLSWNIDRYWRRRLIKSIPRSADNRSALAILDVATGTGDLAISMGQAFPEAKITGVDLAEGMLTVAEKKAEEKHLQDRLSFQKDDALNLSFAENSFSVVTAAFGIRNFQELNKGLSEMYRVLKPGGHLRIIELTTPVSFPMRWLFWIYSHTLLPLYGRMLSKDASAYSYLTATIEAFPQGEKMMEILQSAGFTHTAFRRLTFGICTLYMAEKQ